MKKNELSEKTVGIVERLIDKGCIEVNEYDEIDITAEMAELLLILDRANVFN